jgi:hypothetical protein
MKPVALAVMIGSALVAVAPAAAKEPISATICGGSACRTLTNPKQLNDIPAGENTIALGAPAPYYRVELVVGEGDPAGETHTFALYYVPSADAMAWAEQGAVQLHPIYGDRAIGAMRALVAGISPFPRPRVTSVRVGNRRLAGPAAQSYLQLFSENGESPLGESPDDWIRLDLQSPKASPWTDGRPDLMYSPSANLIERGWQRFQLPDELAADLEAARALEASPSSGASRAWALGLGLLGVAAVGGLARVVRRGARTRER